MENCLVREQNLALLDLVDIILSEISQRATQVTYYPSYIWN